jgi:hypothetical protein
MFYLKLFQNLLDWSSSNQLAVALGPHVYLWNADSGKLGFWAFLWFLLGFLMGTFNGLF